MPSNSPTLLTRIRSEYMEMPGLQLTLPQAQRLCGVERTVCKSLFDTLVAERFLWIKPDGRYARVSEGAALPGSAPANHAA